MRVLTTIKYAIEQFDKDRDDGSLFSVSFNKGCGSTTIATTKTSPVISFGETDSLRLICVCTKQTLPTIRERGRILLLVVFRVFHDLFTNEETYNWRSV